MIASGPASPTVRTCPTPGSWAEMPAPWEGGLHSRKFHRWMGRQALAGSRLDSPRVVATGVVHARGLILWAGSMISAGMRPLVMRPLWARSVL
jgi:hypothetical protein